MRMQPLAYMCVHIALTTMTFALCKLWWASYAAHTSFLLFIFAISAWNGAPLSLITSPAASRLFIRIGIQAYELQHMEESLLPGLFN